MTCRGIHITRVLKHYTLSKLSDHRINYYSTFRLYLVRYNVQQYSNMFCTADNVCYMYIVVWTLYTYTQRYCTSTKCTEPQCTMCTCIQHSAIYKQLHVHLHTHANIYRSYNTYWQWENITHMITDHANMTSQSFTSRPYDVTLSLLSFRWTISRLTLLLKKPPIPPPSRLPAPPSLLFTPEVADDEAPPPPPPPSFLDELPALLVTSRSDDRVLLSHVLLFDSWMSATVALSSCVRSCTRHSLSTSASFVCASSSSSSRMARSRSCSSGDSAAASTVADDLVSIFFSVSSPLNFLLHASHPVMIAYRRNNTSVDGF